MSGPAVESWLPLAVRHGDGEAALELEVRVAPDSTTDSVLASLGLEQGSVAVDSRWLDESERNALATVVLAPGSLLAPARASHRHAAQSLDGVVVEASVVAGPESGRSMPLVPGRYLIAGAIIDVREDPFAASATSWPDRAETIETVVLGDRILAFTAPAAHETRADGRFRRPPRARTASIDTVTEDLTLPPPVSAPSPLSWATILAPLPLVAVMAVAFRPWFAVFGLMGPLVAIARSFEGRRRFKQQQRTRALLVEALRERLGHVRSDLARRHTVERWALAPTVSELAARAHAASVRLWERRPGDDDWLTLAAAIGADVVTPDIVGRSSTIPVEVEDRIHEPITVGPVPLPVNLLESGGVGIVAPRPQALAGARGAVLSLLTTHGPADLRLGLLTRSKHLGDWDWLKWLPHLDAGAVIIAAADGEVTIAPGPPLVLIIDAPDIAPETIIDAARSVDVEVVVIGVGATVAELPASCQAVVEPGENLMLVEVDDVLARSWARALASVQDPEIDDDWRSVGGARDSELFTLLGSPTAAAIEDAWRYADADALPASVGVDLGGGVEFDLVEDGPHVLVGGTTGSGKSEFLRSFALALACRTGPDRLALVFVDFKGGETFDPIANLPHVVGIITDLDVALVERALTGLRLELREREERARRGESLGRLVVMIDEFAALARDHPDVLAGLIDIAERGRSLGVHLVLATQRPSGAVDQRIRANTNLRIALRVQSTHDSHDIVDAPDAARLDRHSPGAAVVRIGGDALRQVRFASTGEISERSSEPFRGFSLATVAGLDCETAAPNEVREGRTALAALTDAIAGAASAMSVSAASPMWLPPLPAAVDMEQLSDSAGKGNGVLLGLEDRVDTRSQPPHWWRADQGGLALFDRSGATAAALFAVVIDSVRRSGDHAFEPVCVGPGSSPEEVEQAVERCERVRLGGQRPGVPRAGLFIDDVAGALAPFDDLARLGIIDRLAALAREAPGRGLVLAVAVRSPRDLPHRLGQHLSHRLVGRLADPASYLLIGVGAPPGREPLHVRSGADGVVVGIANLNGQEVE